MCRVEEAEPWDVYTERTRRAVKEHCCGECGRAITPGETYQLVEGLIDGRWSRHKTCCHCTALSTWMIEMCGGYIFGDLHEELVEHWDEGYRSIVFGRLIIAMKLKWHGGCDPVPTGVRELVADLLTAGM